MARRRNRGEEEPTLFDLPLKEPQEPAPAAAGEEAPAPRPQRREGPSEEELRPDPVPRQPPSRRIPPSDRSPRLPLEGPPEEPADLRLDRIREPAPEADGVPETEAQPAAEGPVEARRQAAPVAGGPPPLSVRFLAGLADLGVHLALAVALLFGARLLGVPAGFGDWLPLVLFLLVFSFLYTILPLAFWGRTPGMTWAGVEARAADGGSLTIGQTIRRWLGGLVTTALLGLPVLLAAGGGGSLADRLSESRSRLTE